MNPNIKINDILTAIQSINEKQKSLDGELESLLMTRNELENKIDLITFLPELDKIKQNSDHLTTNINKTSESAVALSSKVRQLDTAQLRLQAALQRVENVLNLKNTIDKVEKSVEARDYITAATNTHRVIYLMKPVKNELSYQVLVGLESQVRNLVSEECQNAISRRDWQKAMSMSQLFPYLSLPYRGLAFHCLAARSQLADLLHNKGLTLASQPKNALIPHMDLLTQILAAVAIAVKQQCKHVRKRFGSGMELRLVQEMQSEVDVQLCRLLEKYMFDREITDIDNQVKKAQKLSQEELTYLATSESSSPTHQQNQSHPPVSYATFPLLKDNSNLDQVLEELAYICSQSESFDLNLRHLGNKAKAKLLTAASKKPPQYKEEDDKDVEDSCNNDNYNPNKFTQNKNHHQSDNGDDNTNIQGDGDEAGKHANKSSDHKSLTYEQYRVLLFKYENSNLVLEAMRQDDKGDDLAHVSRVNELVQRIIGYYIGLEDFYMTTNIRKAIAINEHLESGVFQSSLSSDDTGNPTSRRKGSSDGADRSTDTASGRRGSLSLSQSDDNIISSMGIMDEYDSLAPVSLYHPHLTEYFDSGLTSTMIDDVFYVLKKCSLRSFATVNASAVCATVNHVNSTLARDLKDAMEAELKHYNNLYVHNQQSYMSSGSGLFGLSSSSSDSKLAAHHQIDELKFKDDIKFLVTLNNFNEAVKHITTLKEVLESEYVTLFEPHPVQGKEMILHCLQDLTETGLTLKRQAKKGVHTIVKILSPRFRPLLDEFVSLSYQLSENEYAQREINDPWIQSFIVGLTHELKSVKECITEDGFQSLINTLVHYTTQRLENHIMSKRFSFWGGLQLDNDIRKLRHFFSGLTSHNIPLPMRDKFARLVQIASILQLEKPSELLDYWYEHGPESSSLIGAELGERTSTRGSGQVWKLHENEVRKILSLRVEFSSHEIALLKLTKK